MNIILVYNGIFWFTSWKAYKTRIEDVFNNPNSKLWKFSLFLIASHKESDLGVLSFASVNSNQAFSVK